MRDRLNVSLPVEMIAQINDLATRRRLTRSAIVEAAVASFLSPDGADRMEAAFTRRFDRLTRQVQRLERKGAVRRVEVLAHRLSRRLMSCSIRICARRVLPTRVVP